MGEMSLSLIPSPMEREARLVLFYSALVITNQPKNSIWRELKVEPIIFLMKAAQGHPSLLERGRGRGLYYHRPVKFHFHLNLRIKAHHHRAGIGTSLQDGPLLIITAKRIREMKC